MKRSEKVKGKEREAARKKQTLKYAAAGAVIIVVVAIVLFFALVQTGAKTGDTVSVLYLGTLPNGTIFDSNMNSTPLTFRIGDHSVIPGFEEAVTGMTKGQVKTVTIPVDKAYGTYRSDLVRAVNRSIFGPDVTPVAGMYYYLTNPTDGSTRIVKVVNFTKNTVMIDQNHVLAGQDLIFTIRLIELTPGK
ncbi:MAG: FKBP-type peptidyl-prolyl cis-trans isomerase [Methanoregula sp. PtaU1.Bin051]|nr:MAG: FKBP-type peptidyl-prolyl cis-trans isomerase [Methanoregula sp. PtaU1.Bin051]